MDKTKQVYNGINFIQDSAKKKNKKRNRQKVF